MSVTSSPAAITGNPLSAFPAFRHYFCARMASTMAIHMLMVVVAWQMYDITHSAYDLGLVGLAQFFPALAFALVTGQVVDRYDRRRILQWCLAGQVATALLLAIGTLNGWIGRELILLASVGLGIAKAFQMPAQQAILPRLVPAAELPRALAVNSAGSQFAIIVGPAVGGFIYVAGALAVYAVCAVLFVLAAAMIALVHINHVPDRRMPVTLETLFAGVGFIWRRKEVLGAISLDLFAVLLGGATALLPIFARDILHAGPWGLGLLRSAPAVGALLVSLYLARHPIRSHVGMAMFASVALYGIATIVFALSTSFTLSLAALAFTGAFDMVSVVIRQSLVQLETPDEMRGRVSAVNSIFIGASNQLGEFESGVTAGAFGAVPSVLIGGIGTIAIVACWVKLFPGLAQRQKLAGA